MQVHTRTRLATLAAATLLTSATAALAESDATGIWYEHNGRGAVEIAACESGEGLCGFLVHLKSAKHEKRCGTQILGNVTEGGGGWIYSPDRNAKFPVSLKRLSEDKLRVVGNAGSFFSKTFTWNRAPDDLPRCGGAATETETKSEAEPAPKKKSEEAAEKNDKPRDRKAEKREAKSPARPVVTGASSASMALLGNAPRNRDTADTNDEPAPVAEEEPKRKPRLKKLAAVDPAPEADAEPQSSPEPSAEKETATDNEVAEAEPQRMCKFKIPYVGRVITVPCRD